MTSKFKDYKDKLIIELDKYLTELAKYEFKSQKEYHHLIHRGNLLYRYDFINLVAVDRTTHYRIHFEKDGEKTFLNSLPLEKQIWVEEHKHDSLEEYLRKKSLEKGEAITIIDFLEEKKIELLKRLPSKYELFLRQKELNGLPTAYNNKAQTFFITEPKVHLRELKPKRKKLKLAKEYNHNLYLKAKERILAYKEQLRLQTN